LVVIENGDYQIWMAHLSEIDVQVGEIVEPGQVLGLSGGDREHDERAGNSSGPNLHYGVKKELGQIHIFRLIQRFFLICLK
jgi:murein DD-endopeptidase MepM/ murein hydrolase activator NlpD